MNVIEQSNQMDKILNGIQSQFDSETLKRLLDKSSVQDLIEWKDKYSLDLFHHCILNNNLVAICLLLNKGCFKPPHEPTTWPYLHLLSCLGHRALISTVIQELKYQNRAVLLKWNVFDAVIKSKLASSDNNFKENDRKRKLTPIDVASLFGHFSTVQHLLDFWQFQNLSGPRRMPKSIFSPETVYLSLACQANSAAALRLMIEEHKDKKEALEFAIRMASAECLDVVLRDKNSKDDLKNAFQGMNLYHVLYTYSRCTSLEQLESIVEVTSVLIFHKHDVNDCRPSRTFPLYSLLCKVAVGLKIANIIPVIISTLLLLLKSGANPNLDEILIEKHVHDTDYTAAFGRRPFSSAVNCLIMSIGRLAFDSTRLPEASEDSQEIAKYGYNCLELLLRHGADLSHVSNFHSLSVDSDQDDNAKQYGSSLHAFFSTRSVSHLSYPFLRLLLHYGIDTDVEGMFQFTNLDHPIKYALNVLPFSVWVANDSNAFLNGLDKNDLRMFVYTMKFMSQSAVSNAFKEFTTLVENLRHNTPEPNKDSLESNHLNGNEIFKKIKDAYITELESPWALQRCCSHVIWRSCRMHMGNIFSLDIPTPLRNVIMHHH